MSLLRAQPEIGESFGRNVILDSVDSRLDHGLDTSPFAPRTAGPVNDAPGPARNGVS
jgi:hypothetical protein